MFNEKHNGNSVNRDLYAKVAMQHIPRLLNLIEKNKDSPHYGCFDRNFCKYNLTDFANAGLQHAVFTLALIYKNDMPGNNWHQNRTIKELACAGLNYWTKIQHNDGSFDEGFPCEHSYAITVFTTYSICESLRILSEEFPISLKNRVLHSLNRAGTYLIKNEDLITINHEIGAVATLYLLYQTTGNEKFLQHCNRKLDNVIKAQSDEGWFEEYGGADIGYLSLSIYYLANYYKLSGDRRALEALNKAVEFISYFIHPDYSVGGDYGSRNTNFLIPDGFEIFARQNSVARAIADHYLMELYYGKSPSPLTMDDRHLCEYLHTFILAYSDFSFSGTGEKEKLPCLSKRRFEKQFIASGLVVTKTNDYYAIMNILKGGVIEIFNREKLVYCNSGWVCKQNNLLNGITAVFDPNTTFSINNDRIHIQTFFKKPHLHTLSPVENIFLRAYSISFGKNAFLRESIKHKIRKKIVSNLKYSHAFLKRSVTFSEEEIRIIDTIDANKKMNSEFTPAYYFPDGYLAAAGIFDRLDHISLINELPDFSVSKLPANVETIVSPVTGEVSVKLNEV